MKSTWFSRKQHYEFSKLLEQAGGYSMGLWDMYMAFIECSYCSLRQAVNVYQTGDRLPELEERYRRTLARAKHPEKLPQAFAIMVEALEQEQYDFLGAVAGELELLNNWAGQFFTPPSLCDMMSKMTMYNEKPDPRHRLTIQEPAVGGGAMVIAVSKELKQNGFQPWHYWVDATDLDAKMFWVSYIQFTLLGIPAVVRNGNTLSMEIRESAVTLLGAIYPLRSEKKRPRKRLLPRRA